MIWCFGDSFTYGDELDNREKDAWPAVLSTLTDCHVVNYGQSGASNGWITRKAIEKCLELKPDLAIVCWSSPNRYDFFPQNIDETARCVCVNPNWAERFSFVKDLYTQWHQDSGKMVEWLATMILLQNFFQNQNIDYIFASVFELPGQNCLDDFEVKKWLDMLDTSRYLGYPDKNFLDWTRNTALGKGGHFLEEGHKRIAERMYDYIRNS